MNAVVVTENTSYGCLPAGGGGTTRGFRYMAFVGGLGLMKSPSQITTTQQHAIDTELTSRDVAVIP